MSLLERNLRLLESAGCETVLILHSADNPLPLLAVPRPLGITVEAAEVKVFPTNPLTILHSLEFPEHDPLFFFDANLLLDPRVPKRSSSVPLHAFLCPRTGPRTILSGAWAG